VADNQRIEDLRRRVHKDPSSIAFAQLAEECRRAGQYAEAIEVCHAGLAIHPGYLSARVTLGRALIELNHLAEAQEELDFVLKSAPENLAAIRGLADIHHRNGSLSDALKHYRAALVLARNDPDLQQTVAELERAVEPPKPPAHADGLSFEQMQSEFLQHLPPPPKPVPPPPSPPPPEPPAALVMDWSEPPPPVADWSEPSPPVVTDWSEPSSPVTDWLEPAPPVPDWSEPAPPVTDWLEPAAPAIDLPAPMSTQTTDFPEPAAPAMDWAGPALATMEWPDPVATAMAASLPAASVDDNIERDLANRTIGALEQWLDAIHVTRAQPRA
jgi:Tetratricopeptide repeat